MAEIDSTINMRVALIGQHDFTVGLTEELSPFGNDLSYFVNTMVRKLHINRHKGFAEGVSVSELLRLLDGEVTELKKAFEEESQFNTALEAVDVANMAFLVALKVWQMTKQEYKGIQNGSA